MVSAAASAGDRGDRLRRPAAWWAARAEVDDEQVDTTASACELDHRVRPPVDDL